MKFNFKKISAIGASVLMTGMTMGVAAAASFPAPFVDASGADVAIVYGANAASTDVAQTTNIQSFLQGKMPSSGGSGSVVTGGDSYLLTKASTKFNLGNGINDVISSNVDDDDLPTLLADGKYIDDDNDEFDYTQKLTIANLSLSMWEDNDYVDNEPSVGFRVASGTWVLNYTLDFSDMPLWADTSTSDFHILGKDYYVLSATTNTTLTLLDAAETTILTEGEATTLNIDGKEYTVSVSFISSSEVKLNINGELTNSVAESQTYKLKDGSYLGIKDILYNSKDTGISKVEFSIGKGKLVLQGGQDVELNEDAINGLTTTFTNSAEKIDKVTISWEMDDDGFVTEDSEIVMPGFGNIKLSYGGMVYPAEEAIEVTYDGSESIALNDFPLKDSVEDINILYWNGSGYSLIGKDSDNKLVTSNTTSLTFDGDTDDWFVVTWTDTNDAESYLVKATNFNIENSINQTTIQYRKDGAWVDKKSDAQNGDAISLGSAELTLGQIDKAAKTVVVTGGSGVSFNTLYSNEGMKVNLPWDSGAVATSPPTGGFNMTAAPSTFSLVLTEEDKNENKASGSAITLTLGGNSATTKEATVSAVSGGGATSTEIGETDVYRDFVYSPLATEILWDKSGDQYGVKLIYHGDESYGDVYLTSGDASVVTGEIEQLGNIVVKDTEVSSVQDKNLIVVGGSCINSVAANFLGGAACGPTFTANTGVEADQYIIKSVADAYTTGKIALIVAGYNAADTVAGVTYLTTQDVDTSKSYKGTSATSAEMITTEA